MRPSDIDAGTAAATGSESPAFDARGADAPVGPAPAGECPVCVDPDGDARLGRPRSEQARVAVLRAVDDLLVEQGYAAMTMKGIAERAGVGRQTVYRWWSTKAEILIEASVSDARDELIAPPRADAAAELVTFLELVERFVTVSPAGLAYRALLGEAQHDPAVAAVVAATDPVDQSARVILDRVRGELPDLPDDRLAAAQLVGPLLYLIMAGAEYDARRMINSEVNFLVRAWGPVQGTT